MVMNKNELAKNRYRLAQAKAREHLLQPPVLILDPLHLGDHRGVHAAVLRPPLVKRRGADRVLPAKIGHRIPTIWASLKRLFLVRISSFVLAPRKFYFQPS